MLCVNTRDTFDSTDRAALLRTAAAQLWSDIADGSAERDPSRLCRFVLLAFPDLKAFTFRYWFAFPALKLDVAATCSAVVQLQAAYASQACDGIVRACCARLQAEQSAFAWLVFVPADDGAAVETHSLEAWAALAGRPGSVALAMVDPCNLPTNPGWPLRNLLALACVRWECRSLRVISVRGEAGRVNAQLSLVLDIVLPLRAAALPGAGGSEAPAAVGWERDTQGQLGPRLVDLRACLDPREQAEQAIDLNLKLMRWRLFPGLDVERLSATRCLLIGAGTLGCAVARTLLAWGVRHITLVDSGGVAFSNPVRQSLFEFEDCLSGGRPKAVAAAEKLQRIFPGAVTRGVVLRVPMPGHAVLPQEEAAVRAEVEQLDALVAEADVCFIGTDTREESVSRIRYRGPPARADTCAISILPLAVALAAHAAVRAPRQAGHQRGARVRQLPSDAAWLWRGQRCRRRRSC
jgi:ubiquitin-like modifier-activating enzyme ATG7